MHTHILIPVALDHEGLAPRKIEVARKLLAKGGHLTLLTVLEDVPGFVAEVVTVKSANHLSDKVRARLDAIGLPHIDNPSHIIPVMVGDPVKCRYISDRLLADHGIYIQPINYPTVPKGTERLRITPSPVHSDADIDRLVPALEALWSECQLARQSFAAQ